MLRFTKKILAVAAIATVITPAFAMAEAGGIAVVDTRYIMDNSKAGKSVSEQIESKRKSYQNELKQREASLAEEKKKIIAEQQGKADKATIDAKLGEFQKKLQDANKLLNSRQSQLEAASLNGIKQVRDKTVDIVKKIASEKGYNAVINKSAALYINDELDITKDVLDKLNSDLPSVSIKAE
jgi:outer membrane protein